MSWSRSVERSNSYDCLNPCKKSEGLSNISSANNDLGNGAQIMSNECCNYPTLFGTVTNDSFNGNAYKYV